MIDLSLRPLGRPRSCNCGECPKCKQADYMRTWWQAKPLEERRALIARRDPERVAAAERKRAKSRGGSIERSRLRHPERDRARGMVNSRIRRGTIVRQPCHCGATKVEAHHPDYSKPLDVVWLCRRHHVAVHLASPGAR